jgi:hypothetical protein
LISNDSQLVLFFLSFRNCG